MTDIKTVLAIAGSDSSGGAGIQADIKSIMANGCYAMTAITALTAQNTLGVRGIQETTPEFLRLQLDVVCEDIYPDAVKIGMVASVPLIEEISACIDRFTLKNIVLDPVMVSTSGSRLLNEDAIDTLMKQLVPKATIITPNIPEAELMSGHSISCSEDMLTAGRILVEKINPDASVLIKGGHSVNDANDLLITKQSEIWIKGERIATQNTHGTGCTLSSSIASYLAKGYDVEKSVRKAKAYISGAMKSEIDLGHGSGPLNHGYKIL